MARKVIICGVDTALLPKLTHKEAEELLKEIDKGNSEARRYFINCNLRLVLSVVQRYSARTDNLDDLFQVGCVGLLKAIDNFDVSLSLRFSTYAVPMIIGEIRRHLREGSLRVSRGIRDTAYTVLKARELLEEVYNDEVPLEEVARALDIPIDKAVYCLDATSQPVSLYEPVYSDGTDCLLYVEQIADKGAGEDNWAENITLSDALRRLDKRERDILRLRYYEGKTQCEVARQVGISQAQVSRLEKNAVDTLRTQM